MHDHLPERLRIAGRSKRKIEEFDLADRLYVGFDKDDIDEEGMLKLEIIRFPDFSCNWSRFSEARDVRLRKNGKSTDGCFSISVETSRYKCLATAVHDPISEHNYENYAHVEIRELTKDEDVYTEPPKGRKLKSQTHKNRRLEYRQNILNHHCIEVCIAQ